MINYIEKGIWLHRAIGAAGHDLVQRDGVWISTDDIAVQAIIDAFDPLPYAKRAKILELKEHAAELVSHIYEFVLDRPDFAVAFYDFATDIYLSIRPQARGTLRPNLLLYKGIYDAAKAAIADINAMTDFQAIMDYDVITDPIWP